MIHNLWDTSWRTARVIAGDVREGDQLARGTRWLMVISVSRYDTTVELKLDGAPEPIGYDRAEPVLVRWQVPSTTIGMAKEVRR